jgi:hypothetical protein
MMRVRIPRASVARPDGVNTYDPPMTHPGFPPLVCGLLMSHSWLLRNLLSRPRCTSWYSAVQAAHRAFAKIIPEAWERVVYGRQKKFVAL